MSVLDAEFIQGVGEVVRAHAGVELNCYRRSTLSRRIHNRMMSAGVSSRRSYLALLRGDPLEVDKLLERVTIKVSWLYRNPAVFEHVRRRILPQLAALNRPLRFWSAGCARGEEAYTLAMLLEEARLPGTILATDVDPGALDQGRDARFEADSFRELPSDLRRRFVHGAVREIDPRVRRRVRFEVHDVLRVPPRCRGGFDLICCRNVLIYLERPFQEQAQRRLCRALAAGGWLILGEAEWPAPGIAPGLDVISRSSRIFRMARREGSNART